MAAGQGRVHASDVTNGASTLLFDIHRLDWDADLLELFGAPPAILPQVVDNVGALGKTEAALFARPIPIGGMTGDQQAASLGPAYGRAKATYGTGCFVLANTGTRAPASRERFLGIITYCLAGVTNYALEGSIFDAGTAI